MFVCIKKDICGKKVLYIVPRNVVNKIKQQITENEKKKSEKNARVSLVTLNFVTGVNEVTLKGNAKQGIKE